MMHVSQVLGPELDARLRDEILTSDALEFVEELHRRFVPDLRAVLERRVLQHRSLLQGSTLDFLPETREVRDSQWAVAPPRPDYEDRRVEITGPTDRKMVINALNSGARGFMADFEDANSPTWSNQISGQANLLDAVEGAIDYTSGDGRSYALGEGTATLMVRPRGLHLPEGHIDFTGGAASAALVDFGLFVHHCARRLNARGKGVYLYLPKLEHHLEARWWNEVMTFSEDALGLARGSIRATVLIETIHAAFQMDEILFELREHSNGLNAGRWDYIFSMIKGFRERPEFVLPDRTDIKMTVPFMDAYTRLLVKTCHSRGAFAMGGMAALVPSRTDAAATERARLAVRADKEREAGAGFDGTWVAHPGVVSIAQDAFDAVLGSAPNQIARLPEAISVSADQLLSAASTPGEITERGVRDNLNVCFRYISAWLGGRGAVAINNMMEDAATAEISRAQIWQWIRHGSLLNDGRAVTLPLVEAWLVEEVSAIRSQASDESWTASNPDQALEVLRRVALSPDFPEFLTLPAYEVLIANA